MINKKYEVKQIDEYRWEVPQQGNMRVPGKIFSDSNLMKDIFLDESIQQVANVAHLPGIVGESLAMPDIHWGYGFPIGGVAAMDIENGVISPGGVGYDINCGVRLVKTSLNKEEIKPYLENIVSAIYKGIPSGVGSKSWINLKVDEQKKLLELGAKWAVQEGMGNESDLERIEDNGTLKDANPDLISERALRRGQTQIGTLGSGNHFIEVGYVEEIYNKAAAEAMGLTENGVTVIIHTGSRGLGHQVCDDNLKSMQGAVTKYGISIPDRQLACAPIQSKEGKEYYATMCAAANYAWANRQVIMHWTMDIIKKALKKYKTNVNFNLIYDVCHNIAKFEDHLVDGVMKKVCVHRKGATRALPADHPNTPAIYKNVGQPVLIPGDMGRYSYVLIGTERSLEETFGSTCHGAGRLLSRKQAVLAGKGRSIYNELKQNGIFLQSHGKRTVLEELPDAYKDVKDVVKVVHNAGISRMVARLRPMGVIKG